MPCNIEYKIGPKKPGNYRPPIEFKIEFSGDELRYRPGLFLPTDIYNLPGPIYKDYENEGDEYSYFDNIRFGLNEYISKPQTLYLVFEVNSDYKSYFGFDKYNYYLSNKIALEKFYNFFDELANSIIKAYEKGIKKAKESIMDKPIIKKFSSASSHIEEIEKEVKNKPKRKVTVNA